MKTRTELAFARTRASVLILSTLVLYSACGGGGGTSSVAPPNPPTQFYPDSAQIPTSGPDVPGATPFDQAATAFLKQWNVPGLALAIAKDGKLLLARGYGYADFEAKTQVQPDSMFRIASISKMLTSAAIMHLRDQGQLDLDQKVVDLLTNFAPGASADPHVRDITIRHLLQHSAGWDSATVGDPAFQSNKITQALAVGSPANSSDLTRYMLNQPLQFAPGSRYAYLNAGYTILGRVIEKISGQSYESYVREQVLAGFGIHAMSIGRSRASERGQLEVEYYPQSNEAPLDADIPGDGKVPAPYATYIARFDSAGGWIASAIDLTRMMAVLESSRIPTFLSADSIAQMLAPPPWPSGGGGPGTWYGFGVDIGPTNATYKHGGALSGTTSMVIHEPQGYTIAILMNSYDTRHPELPLLAQSAMIQALGSGFTGSSSDLYLQYPSPSLPASGQ